MNTECNPKKLNTVEINQADSSTSENLELQPIVLQTKIPHTEDTESLDVCGQWQRHKQKPVMCHMSCVMCHVLILFKPSKKRASKFCIFSGTLFGQMSPVNPVQGAGQCDGTDKK